MQIQERALEITLDNLLEVVPKDRRDKISSSEVLILPKDFEKLEKIDEQPFFSLRLQ